MSAVIPHLTPGSYERHPLHNHERDWPETNCYVDLWIEVLSSKGFNPIAGLGFTVTQDFEGDQFTFFKYTPAALEMLYGASVLELAIYDDVIDHLREQLARGRMPLIEVDGYFLPDTKGVSYRIEHTKTTIGVNHLDRGLRRIEYFHNGGYFAAIDQDFDGLFRLLPEQRTATDALFPYVEFIKFDNVAATKTTLATARALMQHFLSAAPKSNPIAAYQTRFAQHVAKLATAPNNYFHKYTFNVLRQLGANHELLSAHLNWMGASGISGLDRAIEQTASISQSAKALQFQLARAAMRRSFGTYDETFERMISAYDAAFSDLAHVFSEQPRLAARA